MRGIEVIQEGGHPYSRRKDGSIEEIQVQLEEKLGWVTLAALATLPPRGYLLPIAAFVVRDIFVVKVLFLSLK